MQSGMWGVGWPIGHGLKGGVSQTASLANQRPSASIARPAVSNPHLTQNQNFSSRSAKKPPLRQRLQRPLKRLALDEDAHDG